MRENADQKNSEYGHISCNQWFEDKEADEVAAQKFPQKKLQKISENICNSFPVIEFTSFNTKEMRNGCFLGEIFEISR